MSRREGLRMRVISMVD